MARMDPGHVRRGRSAAAWPPVPRRGVRPRWWPSRPPPPRPAGPSIDPADPLSGSRRPTLETGAPRVGPTGPQDQDDGVGEEGDPDHEVGHDHVRIELRVDDDRTQDGLADDAAEQAGRQPDEVAPSGRPPPGGHQGDGRGDARGPPPPTGSRTRWRDGATAWGVSRCCEQVGQSGQPRPESTEPDGRARDDVQHHDHHRELGDAEEGPGCDAGELHRGIIVPGCRHPSRGRARAPHRRSGSPTLSGRGPHVVRSRCAAVGSRRCRRSLPPSPAPSAPAG